MNTITQVTKTEITFHPFATLIAYDGYGINVRFPFLGYLSIEPGMWCATNENGEHNVFRSFGKPKDAPDRDNLRRKCWGFSTDIRGNPI